MKIGGQRILSLAILIAALGLFVAMNFLPWMHDCNARGWILWVNIWDAIWNPMTFGKVRVLLGLVSFLSVSLLISISPFLGNIWVKSVLAWIIVLIFSGVASLGFLFTFLRDLPVAGLASGGWCLILSPVLNFVGLLLARPQWLKKSGHLFPPETHPGS